MLLLPALTSNSTQHTTKRNFFTLSWIGILIGGILLFFLGFLTGRQIFPSTTVTSENLAAPTIQAQTTINKTFQFPITNSTGTTVTNLTYTLKQADKQNQVIIQGQRAYAVAGKTFLILTIKLTNPSNKTIQMNTRDYVRLVLPGNKDLLAPDMYNDPVVIQPISTEYAMLGFSIPQTTTRVTLQIGELSAAKTIIPIQFSH